VKIIYSNTSRNAIRFLNSVQMETGAFAKQ